MFIGGLQKTTLIDYPGKVACTVFLAGCNFRCPWCYSSELVLPEKIKKQKRISKQDFFKFLKSRKGLLDGVVICGGEPTINKDLFGFIKQIKKLGYLVKLDTNGSNPEILKKLIKQKLIDYVAMDVKAVLGKEYKRATGGRANLNNIKKSINLIKNSGIDYEFRTTIVPGIHSKENIIKMAKQIGPVKAYFLQGFRAEKTLDPKFKKVRAYPKKYLLEASESVKAFFTICKVR
jgi:pyruvate formate lyase activating enzyme